MLTLTSLFTQLIDITSASPLVITPASTRYLVTSHLVIPWHGPASIFENHGNHGGSHTHARHHGIPLYRRLALGGPIIEGTPKPHRSDSCLVAKAETQHPQITPSTELSSSVPH